VSLILLVLFKILPCTLSDDDATYKNKISERQSEQISKLKLTKEHLIFALCTLEAVNFTLASVAANEMELSDNLNITENRFTENAERQVRFFASYSFSYSDQHVKEFYYRK
jgi:hypothetical protein